MSFSRKVSYLSLNSGLRVSDLDIFHLWRLPLLHHAGVLPPPGTLPSQAVPQGKGRGVELGQADHGGPHVNQAARFRLEWVVAAILEVLANGEDIGFRIGRIYPPETCSLILVKSRSSRSIWRYYFLLLT